jgi:hypothetical protein
LLFPAFAPAVKAGFRLSFLEGRASDRVLLPFRARLPPRAFVLPAGFAPLL